MVDNEFDPDEWTQESIELALKEARRTFDKAFESSQRLNGEFLDVVKINFLLAGVLVGIVRLTSPDYPELRIGVAGFFLLASLFFARLGYRAHPSSFGLHDSEFLPIAADQNSLRQEVRMVRSYQDWLQKSDQRMKWRSRYLFFSFITIFSVLGVIASSIFLT